MGWFWLFMDIGKKGVDRKCWGKFTSFGSNMLTTISDSAPTEPPSESDGLLLRKIFVWLLKYWTPIRLELGQMAELTLAKIDKR